MKRIFTSIVSTVAAVAICATAFVGCGKDDSKCLDGGEHAYTWTVVTEATCSGEGSRRGVCGICGDVVEESIPVDPDAHSYGDWVITAPTETAEGTAVKTCSLNAEHVYSVKLPAYSLDSSVGYDEHRIDVAPTAATEGKLYLEKQDPLGLIAFTVTVPKRQVTSLDDAVTLAVTLGDTVRTSTGYYTEKTDGLKNEFDVYFGDDFVRVQETGDNTETWYSYDEEGKIFGIYREIPTTTNPQPVARRDESAVDANMEGFSYQSGGGDVRVYGAEGLLKNAYAGYTSVEAVLKSEPVFLRNNDGTIYIEFSFSRYENPRFVRYKVKATLDQSGAIKSIQQDTNIIHAYMIETDIDGQPLFQENGDVVFAPEYLMDASGNYVYRTYVDENGNTQYVYFRDENGELMLDKNGNPVAKKEYEPLRDSQGEIVYQKDENGNILEDEAGPIPEPVYYSDESEDVNKRTIVYEEQTFKSPTDDVEENLYSSDVLYLHSFDLTYNGKVIEDSVTIPSNTTISFGVTNTQPSTATLAYDPLTVYIRTAARDIELTIDPADNSYNMEGGFIKASNQPYVRARYAGDVTLVFKAKGGMAEKVVNVTFTKSAPSSEYPLKAQVNAYNDANGEVTYMWGDYTSQSPYTVYTNQPFTVRAATSDAGSAFIDTSFLVYEVSDAATYEVVGEEVVSYVSNADGTVTFTGKQAGRYTVILRSTIAGAQTASFDVIVEQQPEISSMLISGTVYEGTLKYVKKGEGNPSAADITVTVTNNNNWRQGTLTISVAGNEIIYDYTYSDADGKLTATYKSGPNTQTLDFTFALNEAYRLTVTHSTGFADLTETIVIVPPEAEPAE